MDGHEITASILEKDKAVSVSRDDTREPKPLEEVIKSTAAEIADIFERHPGGVHASPKNG